MLLALFLTTFSLDDFCNQRIIYDTFVTCPCILDPWRAHLFSIFFCFTHLLSKVSRFINVVTLKFSQEAHLDKMWQPLTPHDWLCVFCPCYTPETNFGLLQWNWWMILLINFKSRISKFQISNGQNFSSLHV